MWVQKFNINHYVTAQDCYIHRNFFIRILICCAYHGTTPVLNISKITRSI